MQREIPKQEMEMYACATQVDPKYGGAWLNWGTVLAETGNMDEVSIDHEYTSTLTFGSSTDSLIFTFPDVYLRRRSCF